MHPKEWLLTGELIATVGFTGGAFIDSLSQNNPERTILLICAATLIGIDATILAPRRINQETEKVRKLRKIRQNISKAVPLAQND